jgi:hypothetical protein
MLILLNVFIKAIIYMYIYLHKVWLNNVPHLNLECIEKQRPGQHYGNSPF